MKAGVESLEVKVRGSRIHYLKSGGGPPVLLIHGGASDSRDWLVTMTALSGDCSFYAPDVIGYGQSERNDSGYYLSDFVESLLGLMRELRLNSCVMIGHSLGGRLCLEIALEHPEMVRKLVLVDTAGFGRITRLGSLINTSYWLYRRDGETTAAFPSLSKE